MRSVDCATHLAGVLDQQVMNGVESGLERVASGRLDRGGRRGLAALRVRPSVAVDGCSRGRRLGSSIGSLGRMRRALRRSRKVRSRGRPNAPGPVPPRPRMARPEEERGGGHTAVGIARWRPRERHPISTTAPASSTPRMSGSSRAHPMPGSVPNGSERHTRRPASTV